MVEFNGDQFQQLLQAFTLLNADGQQELFKRVTELTQLQMYKNF